MCVVPLDGRYYRAVLEASSVSHVDGSHGPGATCMVVRSVVRRVTFGKLWTHERLEVDVRMQNGSEREK